MIGTSLKLLLKVCVGKVTYARASYWHHEDNMLLTLGKLYSYSGAVLSVRLSLSYIHTRILLKMRENKRFVKTSPYEYVKNSPSR